MKLIAAIAIMLIALGIVGMVARNNNIQTAKDKMTVACALSRASSDSTPSPACTSAATKYIKATKSLSGN